MYPSIQMQSAGLLNPLITCLKAKNTTNIKLRHITSVMCAGVLPKKNKRGIDHVWDPTPAELYAGINSMAEPMRSCCALIYLTGNRVSEVVGVPERESERKDLGPLAKWKIKPVTKSAFTYSQDNPIVKLTTFTLKRKVLKRHEYLFRIDNDHERLFWSLVEARLAEISEPGSYVWNVSRYRVWKALERVTSKPETKAALPLKKQGIQATGLTPHKLRSLRATRDAVEYALDALTLKEKFNWGSSDMPFKYAKLNTRDLEKRLMGRKEP